MLAAKVEAGELPPVAERLPRNPVLVDPVERLGRYGGTWRMSMRGNTDRSLVYRTIGYEHLLRGDPAWTRVVPNVAQSLSVNDDATEVTFGLRQGMRWSDGHPFTADDIMFWYEDVLKNPELTPKPAPVVRRRREFGRGGQAGCPHGSLPVRFSQRPVPPAFGIWPKFRRPGQFPQALAQALS